MSDIDATALRSAMAADTLAGYPDRGKTGAFSWFGGKSRMVQHILPLLPPCELYVEPYIGAGSLFFSRHEGASVINDLDGRIANFYRVLRDEAQFAALMHRLAFTPNARAGFIEALDSRDDADPVIAAWAFFVAQMQGFSGMAKSAGQWSRAAEVLAGVPGQVSRWRSAIGALSRFHTCLAAAQIDNRDALKVIADWDAPETLFYLDPPYAPDSRKSGEYQCEADGAHHAALVDLLLTIGGAVALSGYETPLYAPLMAAGWRVERFTVTCSAEGRVRGSAVAKSGKASSRVECLWRNPRCLSMMPQGGLFEGTGQ